MRHQPIFVAAYVKDHAVIAYEIDGGSKHRFYITRSMPLGPLNRRIPSTKRTFGLATVYRSFRETRKLPLKPYDRNGPIVEIEMEVRRLVTPAVRDVATGAMIAAGPNTDDEASWRSYRRGQPDRYYAIAKRVLSRRELRRHQLSNAPADIG